MSKLYKIRDWNLIFENNRSRELKSVNWVAVPNRHDGENFSAIMAHKNGAVIYAAWVLMVQVASKCDPRGTLLRGGQKPHNPTSLSLRTRAPEAWFKVALEYLEKETDWLIIQELDDTSHESAGIPHPCADSSVLSIPSSSILSIPSGRGCKGKPNSLQEVIEECTLRGFSILTANDFWNYYESNGWKVGKNPMAQWRSALAGWDSRNKNGNGHKDAVQLRREHQKQREFSENIIVKDL